MARIDNNLTVNLRPDASAVGARHSGSLNGEQVVPVKSELSLLEDAREEMSVAIAQLKGESKTASQRKFSGGSGVRRMQIEQIQAYLDATRRYPDPKQLANLVRQMQASARPRDLVQQSAQSPAHWFALLQYALDDAHKSNLGTEVIERLLDALEELELEYGSQIQAGLHSAQAAHEFAPDAQGVENFERAYTDIVLGEHTFAQTLQVVVKRLSGARGEDFQRGLQALLAALGAELTAVRASTQPERLRALVQDIYRLQVAGTSLEVCMALADEVSQRFGILSIDPVDLMLDLVAYTGERWAMPGRLTELAIKFKVAGLPERLWFHRGTRNALREMPVAAFLGVDERELLLKTAMDVCDATAAEEEKRMGEL